MNANKNLWVRALFAVALGVTACSDGSAASAGAGAGQAPKQAPRVTATRVEAARVTISEATMRLVRPGEVEPARESRVAAAVGGLVEKVPVDVGDFVKKGAVLARVDSRMQGANLKVLKVELADTERELGRLESMGKSVPRARVDAARTQVERAKAQLSVAQLQASRAVVRAPFAGTIADVGTEVGEILTPGMLVARVVQTDPAVVSVSVADRDVGSLRVGGLALVSAAGLARPIAAEIRRIEPTANEKTRTFTVELELENPKAALLPGMIASVDFRETVATEAILLPQDLLVTRLDANGVFVVDEGQVARWRALTLGDVIRDQVVITGGLTAGERIVVLGHRGLANGDPLIVARDGVCCTDGRVVFESNGRAAAGTVPAGETPR